MVSGGQDDPVRLGIISDIQYANKPDRYIEYVGLHRKYNKALPKVSHAVQLFNSKKVCVTIHLGDIIDGNEDLSSTWADLNCVLDRLKPLESPLIHVLGNHCLAAGREYMMKRLNLKNSYYYRDVSPLWRIIVLDTVDVSVDREESHSNHALAIEWLKENRHRANAVEWNGGIGPEQLHWLKNVLEETKKEERLAIVCGHIPIVSGTKSEQHTVWDSDVIVELFAAFQTTVKAYFAGHYHEGCYAFKDNIHYVTFEAVLDADHDDGSCGVVLLHKDHIKVEGNGTMTSRTLVL